MIDDAEIRQRALSLGVQQDHVERDYVLNHLLAQLSEDPGSLIFRGGTALARVYWPDFRLSEDLDFVTPADGEDIERIERRIVLRAKTSTGIDLDLEFGAPRRDRSRSLVRWSTPWDTAGSVVIDVVRWSKLQLPKEERVMSLPYSDLAKERSVPVLQLAEIVGTKWGMLDDRDEPRDLFDLWWGLTQGDLPFDEIARGHRATYGHDPLRHFLERASRLRRLWHDRLGHQVSDLPDFDVVLASVRSSFDSWEAGRCANG